MSDLSALNELAKILTYPVGTDFEIACQKISQRNLSDKFCDFTEKMNGLTGHQREEVFTKTFDINGPCCLDVGYVMFGEDYKRGAFLVGLKDLYRRINFETGTELPDHLPYIIDALTKMDEGQEQRELAEKILVPSIDRMIGSLNGLEGEQAMYKIPLQMLNQILKEQFILGQRGLV